MRDQWTNLMMLDTPESMASNFIIASALMGFVSGSDGDNRFTPNANLESNKSNVIPVKRFLIASMIQP